MARKIKAPSERRYVTLAPVKGKPSHIIRLTVQGANGSDCEERVRGICRDYGLSERKALANMRRASIPRFDYHAAVPKYFLIGL